MDEGIDYEFYPFPTERELVIDAGYLAAKRHIIYALLDVDVTTPRRLIRECEESGGDKISFTAYIVACLSRAITEHPKVQAYLDWRRRVVVFRDVDVVTMIEPEAGAVAIPHIIRSANSKSVEEISAEIRSVQANPARSEQRSGRLVSLAPRLPRFIRMFFFWVLKKDPSRFKQQAGTVIVTSVGMFGKGGGWGITFLPTHTLGLTVGGIVQKPGVHEGEIAIREYLGLTLSFDHDIVDGAPATRFARTLVNLIGSGDLLIGCD